MSGAAPPGRLRRTAAAGWALVCWPVFSRTSYRMVRALASHGLRPQTVIDVGANQGQFAVAARNLLRPARIHAFEPLPGVADRLARHCERYPEVVVHRLALGEACERATLHINAHHQSSSLLRLGDRHLRSFPDAQEIGHVEVQLERLDAALDRSELVPPVLVKIDAQGSESRILRGAACIADVIDHLVVETSFTPLYEGESTFIELLGQAVNLGFRFERPVGVLVDPRSGEFLQMDALFVRSA